MRGNRGVRGERWGGGMHGEGSVCAGQTATEAGGTHPTGMHSCSFVNYDQFPTFLINLLCKMS